MSPRLGTGPVSFAGGQLSLRSDNATNNFANVLSVSSGASMLMDIGPISTRFELVSVWIDDDWASR